MFDNDNILYEHFQCSYQCIHNAFLNVSKIDKNCKNLLTSSTMLFSVNMNRRRKLSMNHKVNAQGTIAKRYLSNIFKMKNQFPLRILVPMSL